ncbi:hypothetical protein RUM44_004367 [Polyplax serrata]|uniref:Uncharacterized protein n=1 Tax=Polyplax serrata TaxID=468196 RepID=A0ABR1B2P3_POLSC
MSESDRGKVKSGRKLKDYPQVPTTPPPSDKKDRALTQIEDELEREKKYLYALCMENKELEEIIENYDKETTYLKTNLPQQIVGDKKMHSGNEYWFKYETQMELIRKLERERKNLESEIKQIEEQGMINLDSLSQSELIMYVKQLERSKTNLLSELRSKEWGLDKQAKDIHHLNEMKRALQAEIRHYDKEFSLFRHYKKNSCPSASPTERRNSLGADEKRMKIWSQQQSQREGSKSEEPEKQGNGKRSSYSPEDDAETVPKTDVMFSSLDEAKLERMEFELGTPGCQKRTFKGSLTERKRGSDTKKGTARKTVVIGSLPELSKNKAKTPSPREVKLKRSKPENKVGTDSPNSSKPIKIIVTYETQRTVLTSKSSESEKPSSPDEEEVERSAEKDRSESARSVDEVYEEDYEESDTDKSEREKKKVGFLSTRV